jgi:MFS-type transporter involved in bile tolerance (Atg22 family)
MDLELTPPTAVGVLSTIGFVSMLGRIVIGTLGGAAGPLMAGRAFDVTGNYRIAFLVLTLLAVIGFVLITLLQPPREEDAGR